ncbi:hypothetical protein LXL04_021521 [Taraxacum kok-saghyz]
MNLLRAQQKMEHQANKRRRDVEYQVGDLVYLKLRPYRQHILAKRKYDKLVARYYGPYPIIQKIGKVAYKLQLPDSAAIHPTFHVSQLRPTYGGHIPLQLNSDCELVVHPAALKGVRNKGGTSAGDIEVLIQWSGLMEADALWEDYEAICEQFPHFHLEDKVKVWPAGIDTNQPFRVYQRRNRKPKNTT